jgi:integrase
VFGLPGRWSGKQLSPKRVSRTISAIGEKAGVVVNKADGKYASAHDLRRAYGTRWASKVKTATLKLLMRHACIETTEEYYVDLDADEVAAELWAQHASGNILGNTHSRPADADSKAHAASHDKSSR